MMYRSVSAAYLNQAATLKHNPGQLAAFDSKGHCVVLAGPGSGKTKTLVLKLARVLAEDVQAPRGVACITYSQECARELGRRLDALGIRAVSNVFVGTVHSFCLRHLLIPYARLAGLPVPYPITLATVRQSDQIFGRVGDKLFGVGHPYKKRDMERHRRVYLDRDDDDWRSFPELADLSEAYEAELRNAGLIDFDDLVIFGNALVAKCDWVLPLIEAKFPFLAVDEYQDLGVPLHRIVKRLAFDGGARLFAVGDVDQSIYGFTGADGGLLEELAQRTDVEPIRLQINYRSAGRIVKASELVLGEVRGYRPADAKREATIGFIECPGGLTEQATVAVTQVIPAALAAKPGRELGDIAVLYRNHRIGTFLADAATAAGLNFIRMDSAAPYRKCALTSWVEDCAAWCAGGWRKGQPQLHGIIARWLGFRRTRLPAGEAARQTENLVQFLWDARRDNGPAGPFVSAISKTLIEGLLAQEPSLADQGEYVASMRKAFDADGTLAALDLAMLGGRDGSPDHLNLVTLHSAKGCEYDVVIMLGMDLGELPWRNETPAELKESKRLFYVGLTRARDEVYMLYSGWVETRFGRRYWGRSPFLDELEERLAAADAAAST